MKNLFFSITMLLIVNAVQAQEKSIGGGKDSHGCLTAAGYQWSVLKKDCIRVFELKNKLNEVHPKGASASIAGVIFSRDMKKVEIILNDDKENLILVKNGRIWKKGKYTLKKTSSNHYSLIRNNKEIYKS